jgi:hypothetical protein
MQADIIRDEVRKIHGEIANGQVSAACCDSTLLTTCCEPSQKESCCGVERAVNHDVAPRTCGCSTSTGRSPREFGETGAAA